MNTKDLNETLASLHDELSHGQELDEESRERLRVLLDDIREALDQKTTNPSVIEQKIDLLSERLKDAVIEFRAALPQISQLLGRIADGLSNMGI